jgi:uncharacterized protein YyaL (SSP411 family)
MPMPAVEWLSWNAATFERARAERRPVLLSIVAGWSGACRAMDETSYADAAVVRTIGERFVPVRVYAERRPDIAERYSLGGWPTTAFLTPDGAVFGGGTFVPAGRMASALLDAASAFDARPGDIAALAGATEAMPDDIPIGAGETVDEPEIVRTAFASFDEENGGFGTAPKFPLTGPIRLALQLCRDGDDGRAAHMASLSLDAIGWGPLHDDGDGGFYRCAAERSWARPYREKLLDVNAALAAVYVEAADVLGATRYLDRAQDALRYVQNWLADPVDGGWGGFEMAAAASADGSVDEAGGRPERPPVDRTLFAASNGTMVRAALQASRVFQDDGLGAFAITSLERVLAVCYRPGAGVAHCVEDGVRTAGFLDDNIAIGGACLDAFDATGNIVYEMMAEELVRYAIRTMWDGGRGLFFDRAEAEPHEAIGLMRRRLVPFTANCEAAALLARLSEASGEVDFDAAAESVMAALSGAAASRGADASHYILARRAVRRR